VCYNLTCIDSGLIQAVSTKIIWAATVQMQNLRKLRKSADAGCTVTPILDLSLLVIIDVETREN